MSFCSSVLASFSTIKTCRVRGPACHPTPAPTVWHVPRCPAVKAAGEEAERRRLIGKTCKRGRGALGAVCLAGSTEATRAQLTGDLDPKNRCPHRYRMVI